MTAKAHFCMNIIGEVTTEQIKVIAEISNSSGCYFDKETDEYIQDSEALQSVNLAYLSISHDEAEDGYIHSLESYLRQNKIAYIRQTDAFELNDTKRVVYYPTKNYDAEKSTNLIGVPVIEEHEVLCALKLFSSGNIQAGIEVLRSIVKDEPEMPKLNIVEVTA